MKRAAIAFVVSFLAIPAFGQDAPTGWTHAADGSYAHTASGIICPASLAGYAFKSLSGPSDPNFDGVCTYDNGKGETGLVRVRHYVEGVGETPLAIQNDYGLMHPDAAGTQGKMVGAYRGGPGPMVDGVQTYQSVLTTTHNGYLIDCIARHTDRAMPPGDFTSACPKFAN